MTGKAARLFALDCGVWAGLHLGASVAPQLLPDRLFQPNAWPWRIRDFEAEGRIYAAIRVGAWQHRLPDGTRLTPGATPRPRPNRGDSAGWHELVVRTARSEAAHWLAVLCGPGFAFFNPPLAAALLQGYALGTNLPCIIVQRYNRARLLRVSERRRARQGDGSR